MPVHPMTVTSPITRGPEVKRRQRLLSKNIFKQDYMSGGALDAEFGPETARAVIRAKYWLGYTRKDQTPVYGQFLDDFLRGRRPLPKIQLARRQSRLKKLSAKPLREKALARARQDIGMKENPPRSNWSPISRRWGVKGPWCGMAVSEWYIDVGSKAFREHVDWAYVPFMLAAAEHGQHGLVIIRAAFAQPGDIVCYDWDGDGVADHTGLLQDWLLPGQTFDTVEGNTGIGNDSNGGRVMERNRAIGQVAKYNGAAAFIRVGR